MSFRDFYNHVNRRYLNMERDSAILLIAAPDREGLVYTVTDYIYRNSGNILHAEQHIDSSENIFFMRIEWDITNFKINQENILSSLEDMKQTWRMDISLYFSKVKTKTAVFVSKKDHCLHDVLYKTKNRELGIDISCIISNHEENRRLAQYYEIPFYLYPMFKDNKQEQERMQLELMKNMGIELIILARYMQILSPEFVTHYQNRIINVHHSFLPAFIGANPYKQAYEKGVKIIGSTAHYVTDDLDKGPIIAQEVIHVDHKDSLDDFICKGKELEKQVLTNAVKKHSEHKILEFQNKTVVFD